ncbi:adenylosuccinate synthetase [Candidatus Nitrosocosmicus hydrocola]|uniref:adenylosuccinate synthetase n=1 Tax=Candidatus Nitrosocosmicus hydrocola TaxID=1826872 RepID=UPI000AEB0D14|nr:adenylosuccinate synthetase [Candidatus Nitrosocosmicus hydrocola]
MPCVVTVGGFYGDEGKGKVVAYLSIKDNFDIAARGGVGPNAGHTFIQNGKEYKVRMLPSAVLNANTRLLVGAGVLVEPSILLKEIQTFNTTDRTFVDFQCGIIDNVHQDKDKSNDHLKKVIGTTGSGTGPANADRALRNIKLAKDIPEIALYLEDVSNSINHAIDTNEKVLIEGTQGTFLSLFHGTYPFVTSKDVTASAICSDVGIGPKKVDDVLIVFKSYVTRVGEGPLNCEITPEQAREKNWLEFGSVTGRQRRSAPFDYDLAKKAIQVNSATQIALTKLDVLYPQAKGIKDFSKLPQEAKDFVSNIESETGLPVTIVGTGAEIMDTIDRR